MLYTTIFIYTYIQYHAYYPRRPTTHGLGLPILRLVNPLTIPLAQLRNRTESTLVGYTTSVLTLPVLALPALPAPLAQPVLAYT